MNLSISSIKNPQTEEKNTWSKNLRMITLIISIFRAREYFQTSSSNIPCHFTT